jgi:sugar lactone lactonase YvrE
MRKTTVLASALVGALLVPGGLWGVRTAEWETAGREKMAKGNPVGVTIGPLGSLELAPRFEPLGEVAEYYAWALVSNGRGDLFVGTGDQGKIFKVDRSGKTVLLFDSLELDILSLALDAEGNLYAGTAPDGIVYRVDKNGNATTFFDTPENYVWDLAFDKGGDLLVCTGEQGKVYRVDPAGKAELLYDSPETNILRVLPDEANDRILLGGEGAGLLIALDSEGAARVLFDAPRAEIGDILAGADGRIYLACSGAEASRPNEKESAAKGKPLLYRLEANGTAVLLWESDAEFIYTLAPGPDGAVLVGTGTPGAVVSVSPEGEATEVKRTSESQVLGIQRDGEDTYVATGNQGRLYRFGPEKGREGTYESEVEDAGNLSRWGNLRWSGSAAAGTSLLFSTRSGNTGTPDETWSGWAPIEAGERGGRVVSPAARFLQWRAELRGKGEASPRIDRVSVAFKQHNLPPRVLSVDVTRVGDPFYQGPVDPRPEPLFQVLSDGARVEYQPMESREKPPKEAVEIWARSVRVVRWQAADPNGDDLLSDVSIRSEDDFEWKLLDEDLSLNYYSWDTRSMTDGEYRVRVTARDLPTNSEETALAGERVSESFLIDNSAPEIVRLSADRDGDRIRVRAEARDALSLLRTAEVTVNAVDWVPVDPMDEIFDDRGEEFDFTVGAEEGERPNLGFRVFDQAGNVAVGKAVVR